ncbi:hypothetical protein [Burkholderia sp. AW49-1]
MCAAQALEGPADRPVLDATRHTAAAFCVRAAAVKQTGRSPRPRHKDRWGAVQAIEHDYVLMMLDVADFADLAALNGEV